MEQVISENPESFFSFNISSEDHLLIYGTLLSVLILSIILVVIQNIFISIKLSRQLQKAKSDNFDHEKSKIFNILPNSHNINGHRFIDAILSEYSVSIIDKDSLIVFANSKLCTLSEYSEYEIVGNTHNIFDSGYHNKQFWDDVENHIDSEKIWSGEIKNKSKNGKYFWGVLLLLRSLLFLSMK